MTAIDSSIRSKRARAGERPAISAWYQRRSSAVSVAKGLASSSFSLLSAKS
jgi:hypothetical protein